jgi:hypothetical protein
MKFSWQLRWQSWRHFAVKRGNSQINNKPNPKNHNKINNLNHWHRKCFISQEEENRDVIKRPDKLPAEPARQC